MDKDYEFTGYNSFLKPTARELRAKMTPQEKHLWYDFLRTYPVRFYRQRIIERYIVDFYCSAAKLVIEVDGSQHYTDAGLEHDEIRTEVLQQYGLCVLRFTNKEINSSFADVCQTIDRAVKAQADKI